MHHQPILLSVHEDVVALKGSTDTILVVVICSFGRYRVHDQQHVRHTVGQIVLYWPSFNRFFHLTISRDTRIFQLYLGVLSLFRHSATLSPCAETHLLLGRGFLSRQSGFADISDTITVKVCFNVPFFDNGFPIFKEASADPQTSFRQ
jgi:hypothetical protein